MCDRPCVREENCRSSSGCSCLWVSRSASLVITNEYVENGPRDRRVNLEKWLKVKGEVSGVSVSEKKGKA